MMTWATLIEIASSTMREDVKSVSRGMKRAISTTRESEVIFANASREPFLFTASDDADLDEATEKRF
jgi:hypothetical protein